MAFSTRSHSFRWSGVILLLLLLAAGLGLQGMKSANSRPGTAPTLPTPVDPRLILHPHTESFTGTIAGGIVLNGTLSPSVPGVNTIALRLHLPGRQAARVSLVLSMPGMAMPPVRATLTTSSRGYYGSAILPMFGRYRAQVDASTSDGRFTGTINITLPLTLSPG